MSWDGVLAIMESSKFVFDSPPAAEDMRGPTESSNWVVPGRLLTGGYPGDYNYEDSCSNIRKILAAGVTLIVPLVEPVVLQYWPYESLAKEIAMKEFNRQLQFNYFPIPDISIADDDSVVQFVPKLAEIIREGTEIVYVHCFSGHGRSGIIVSLLLSVLFDVDGNEALRLANVYHSKRLYAGHRSTPETREQCSQVRRVAEILRKKV